MSDVLFGNRLLVIDDEIALCRIVQKIAEHAGFEVETTDDPDVFLKQARFWHPTVIIMDLKMPRADGIELLRALAGDNCTARIIIISGSDARVLETTMRLGRERGLQMVGVLPKPIRAQDLREMLAACIEVPKETLQADLSHAIDDADDGLFVVYQPKLDRITGRITSVEALARWRHPKHGLISPDEFILLAEETDLIDAITLRVVAVAARQVAAWSAENLPLDVAVNLSARSTEDVMLPERLCCICEEAGIGPDRIILELTETGATRESIRTMEVLTRLRLQGFRLSIDDFGTGYSSLVQLQRLPFSELKIDKSFVGRMLQDGSCRTIVEIIIVLARKLGLKTVAEGVEDAETLRVLFEMGCDYVQGYYLSRPKPAQELRAILTMRYPIIRAAGD